MEHINFGIDKHSQIKANDHNQAQCIHCRSPAPYIVQPDNRDADDEVSVCGYCVHYYRMNELGENDKVIFTAGLQAKWISHLQKAIQSAKNSGKTEKVKQAEQLEQWLFAHAKFVAASQWGTDSPVAIDAAVERTLPTKRSWFSVNCHWLYPMRPYSVFQLAKPVHLSIHGKITWRSSINSASTHK